LLTVLSTQYPGFLNQDPLFCAMPPSHYGSFQTIICCYTPHSMSSFHPTMVLSKHTPASPIERWERVFPSHYGSFQTLEKVKDIEEQNVSIPLWFFPNQNTLAGFLRWLPGFHPTMVLSKPYSSAIILFSTLSFHPTMVLSKRS